MPNDITVNSEKNSSDLIFQIMQGNLLFHVIGNTLWSAKAIHSAIKYIEHNPVRARLVSQSDQYPWSSAWARRNRSGLIPDDLNIPMLMKS